MKDILIIILIIILLILIIIFSKNQENFINQKFNCTENNSFAEFALTKEQQDETLKIQDNWFDTPNDISVCNDQITINSYDDYSTVDISKITNQINEIDNKYFKINYYNSRDQDNNIIKLASIKSYLGLPGYLPANIHDYSGDLKHFDKNYNTNIDDKLKNLIVSNAYNYVNNIDYN